MHDRSRFKRRCRRRIRVLAGYAACSRNPAYRLPVRFLLCKEMIYNIVDLSDAVAMILALVVFTSFIFLPSPVPTDAAGQVQTDSGQSQPVAVRNLSFVLAGVEERLDSGHALNFTPVP
jgi:hypothetical protein